MAEEIAARREGGFSLIELTLVVAIMAISLVVIMSNIDYVLPATRITAWARRLASFVESGFSRALAAGKPVLIVYDLDEQSYYTAFPPPEADADGDPDSFEHSEPRYMPGGIRISEVFVGDRSHTSGKVAVKVTPTGRVRAHTVFLEDEGGRKLTLEVAPLTSTVSILEGHVEPRRPLEDEGEETP